MKHVDKLFKEKLYNHEAVVPDGMWEKIAPIAEEESGRAILWFWFAGLLTLLVGGYGIYNMVNSNSNNNQDSSTLVYNVEPSSQAITPVEENTPTLETIENTQKEIEVSEPIPVKIITEAKTSNVIPETKKQTLSKQSVVSSTKSKTQKQQFTETVSIPEIEQTAEISNTVESIFNAEGTPANLVITKSYVNKEGSIIKQSNLTTDSGNENPVYDVILNSEVKDLNAGALLRIIEPLENIQLPYFHKKLKKKNLTSTF